MLTATYDPVLVAASVAVAIMASFTGLRLTSGISALNGRQRRAVIAQAAIALGSGIWSMHFVGMLAVELPITIAYDALPTLTSALLAILVVGLGLILLHFGARTQSRIISAGLLTGLGIVGMHYVGMAAVSGNCVISYNPAGVALATGIAVIASILALEFAYRRRTLLLTAVGSIVLGLAISTMHYAAMISTSFSLGTGVEFVREPILSTGILALVVALAAFVICGLFLLTAVPIGVAGSDSAWTVEEREPARHALPRPEFGAGAGHAAVSSGRSDQTVAFSKAFNTIVEPARPMPARIPYQKDNTIRFLVPDQIAAIRADGHYARIIDGVDELFCPWSISKIAEAVALSPFIRTHRSFLVNLNHVSGFKRDGDRAFCLVGEAADTRVPVSRSQIPTVQKALGLA